MSVGMDEELWTTLDLAERNADEHNVEQVSEEKGVEFDKVAIDLVSGGREPDVEAGGRDFAKLDGAFLLEDDEEERLRRKMLGSVADASPTFPIAMAPPTSESLSTGSESPASDGGLASSNGDFIGDPGPSTNPVSEPFSYDLASMRREADDREKRRKRHQEDLARLKMAHVERRQRQDRSEDVSL